MSGFTYKIKTEVEGESAIMRLAQNAEHADTAINRLASDSRGMGNAVESAGQRASAAFGGMKSMLIGLVAQIGIVTGTMASINTAVDTTAVNNAIQFIGAEEGAKNLEFARATIDSLKMPLATSLEGFKSLTGGMMGSGIAIEQQRNLYKSFGESALVMGLSAEQSQGALLALAQMASKGTVSAEELKGQLGERLPGAFNIAARAMGTTTAGLNQMLERGEVMASDFLPRFAEELHRTFGPGVQAALDSPRAKFNEMSNAVFELKNRIGNELMPTVTSLMNDFLIPAVTWFGENITLIGGLVTVMGSLYLAAKLYNVVTGIQAVVTAGFTGSIWGLNAALLANPITWVVAGIVALGAGAVYAWNKFDGFRGAVVGVWNVIKELGSIVYDYAIAPLVAVGELLWGIVSFDYDMIKKGINDGIAAVDNIANGKSAGERLGAAFTDGWNSQVKAMDGPLYTVDEMLAPEAKMGPLKALGAGPVSSTAVTSASQAQSAKTGKQATDIANGISGGGTRNITINGVKLVENLTLYSQNVQEGVDQIGDIINRKLIEAINSFNQIQTN